MPTLHLLLNGPPPIPMMTRFPPRKLSFYRTKSNFLIPLVSAFSHNHPPHVRLPFRVDPTSVSVAPRAQRPSLTFHSRDFPLHGYFLQDLPPSFPFQPAPPSVTPPFFPGHPKTPQIKHAVPAPTLFPFGPLTFALQIPRVFRNRPGPLNSLSRFDSFCFHPPLKNGSPGRLRPASEVSFLSIFYPRFSSLTPGPSQLYGPSSFMKVEKMTPQSSCSCLSEDLEPSLPTIKDS